MDLSFVTPKDRDLGFLVIVTVGKEKALREKSCHWGGAGTKAIWGKLEATQESQRC